MNRAWEFLRNVAGFRQVHSTTEERLAVLETSVNWIARGFWLLLVAIIARPFLG